jgi:hypothetical protein
LIGKDLRDKPTRDTCGDGIFILLVGKPNGRDEFLLGIAKKEKQKNQIKDNQRIFIHPHDFLMS